MFNNASRSSVKQATAAGYSRAKVLINRSAAARAASRVGASRTVEVRQNLAGSLVGQLDADIA